MCQECATERQMSRSACAFEVDEDKADQSSPMLGECDEYDILSMPSEHEDDGGNLAATYVENSQGAEVAGSYYVGPAAMVDQELRDEYNYNFDGVDGDDEYDLKNTSTMGLEQ